MKAVSKRKMANLGQILIPREFTTQNRVNVLGRQDKPGQKMSLHE